MWVQRFPADYLQTFIGRHGILKLTLIRLFCNFSSHFLELVGSGAVVRKVSGRGVVENPSYLACNRVLILSLHFETKNSSKGVNIFVSMSQTVFRICAHPLLLKFTFFSGLVSPRHDHYKKLLISTKIDFQIRNQDLVTKKNLHCLISWDV